MSRDLATLRSIVDARRVALAFAEADLYEAENDPLSAEWKRAEAEGRTEDSTRAWVLMMARAHLAHGGPVGDHLRDEILAEMARIRVEGQP